MGLRGQHNITFDLPGLALNHQWRDWGEIGYWVTCLLGWSWVLFIVGLCTYCQPQIRHHLAPGALNATLQVIGLFVLLLIIIPYLIILGVSYPPWGKHEIILTREGEPILNITCITGPDPHPFEFALTPDNQFLVIRESCDIYWVIHKIPLADLAICEHYHFRDRLHFPGTAIDVDSIKKIGVIDNGTTA